MDLHPYGSLGLNLLLATPARAAKVLIELTTHLTSFSSAPTDPAKFSVPAEFTQVQAQAAR
jgi:hypothetical protein